MDNRVTEMEHTILNLLVLTILLSNIRLLNTSRIPVMILAVAIQGFVIGLLPLVLHWERIHITLFLISLITIVIKGVILPRLLNRSMQQAGVIREVEPFVGPTASLLIGLFLLALSYWITFPLRSSLPEGFFFVPVLALFTVFNGLFLIVSRKKAITQVIGYLTMENGVYAFGASLAVDHPFLVELGVLLDVWVGVFIMGIAIYHINREFDHIDTDKLSTLKH